MKVELETKKIRKSKKEDGRLPSYIKWRSKLRNNLSEHWAHLWHMVLMISFRLKKLNKLSSQYTLSTGIKNNNNNLTCQAMASNELFFSLSYRKKCIKFIIELKPFRQPLMVQGCIIYIRNLPINPGGMLPTQSSSISAKIARYLSS